MADAGTYIIPEWMLCKFVRDRLAAIEAESPDKTIKRIFEYTFPADDGPYPKYTDIRAWLEKTNVIRQINVGNPLIGVHAPRVLFAWGPEAQKNQFIGMAAGEKPGDEAPNALVYERGAEFSSDVECHIQAFGELETVWLFNLIQDIFLTELPRLEDLGVRGVSTRSQPFMLNVEGADGRSAEIISGRVMLISCTFSRITQVEQDTSDIDRLEDVSALYSTAP